MCPLGRSAPWGEGGLGCRARWQCAARQEALGWLSRKVDERNLELKREQSVLDNDDLVALALHAVRDNPVVADDYRGRFKLVMVDESQDTDASQLELITLGVR